MNPPAFIMGYPSGLAAWWDLRPLTPSYSEALFAKDMACVASPLSTIPPPSPPDGPGLLSQVVWGWKKEKVIAAAGFVAGAAVVGAAAYAAVKLCRRMGITWNDVWDGNVALVVAAHLTRADEAAVVRKERRIDQLVQSRRGRGLISTLDDSEVADIPDAELSNRHLPFAVKWGQLARIHHMYPTLNEANRIIVTKWIYEQWKERHVRDSDILQALPMAVKLAFVKSGAEIIADLEMTHVPQGSVSSSSA